MRALEEVGEAWVVPLLWEEVYDRLALFCLQVLVDVDRLLCGHLLDQAIWGLEGHGLEQMVAGVVVETYEGCPLLLRGLVDLFHSALCDEGASVVVCLWGRGKIGRYGALWDLDLGLRGAAPDDAEGAQLGVGLCTLRRDTPCGRTLFCVKEGGGESDDRNGAIFLRVGLFSLVSQIGGAVFLLEKKLVLFPVLVVEPKFLSGVRVLVVQGVQMLLPTHDQTEVCVLALVGLRFLGPVVLAPASLPEWGFGDVFEWLGSCVHGPV